jgi:hypothetical protein
MRGAVRLLQLLLLLLLATATLSLLIALSGAQTGPAEKVVLAAGLAVCVYLATRVPRLVARVEARLRGH